MLTKGRRRRVLAGLYRARVPQLVNRWWPHRLTVLAYHRVSELGEAFATYRRTVSASPSGFSEQLAFLSRHCNVVSLAQVIAAVDESAVLPPRSVLITFDDGYRDNVRTALPLLEAHGMGATVFLATDYVGTGRPFFWDLAANLFHRTRLASATLPFLGPRHWASRAGGSALAEEFVERVKRLSNDARDRALTELAEALRCTLSRADFDGLYLTWEDVRQGAKRGLEFGSHTRSHAILPGLPVEQVKEELVASKARIERELQREVTAFAYPNGSCNRVVETLVKEAGYKLAFAVRRGPLRSSALPRRPWAARRVPVYARDTLPVFAAKLVGLS